MLGDRTAKFFLACSKFDGTRSARGVCLAHLGDSTAHVWRTHSVNEDPWAYVAYLPRICDFFRTPVEQGHRVCYMYTPCRRYEVRSALVTKWGNLSEWHICNIPTMFIAFWYLKKYIYFISLWHPIRVTYMNICHPRVTLISPASDVWQDICGFFNSLAPGGFENIFQNVFFKLISWIDTLSNSCETALRSMPQNPSEDKSTLVQVMAWCRQAASHYLSQCCPKSLSPYGVTRPQWVN